MTDSEVESDVAPSEQSQNGGLQIVAAVLLGIAATLTAVAVFNSSLRDGESLRSYTASTRALSDANYWWSQANDTFTADFALFIEFAKAANADDEELAVYLVTLMRPEMQDAVEWWADHADEALDPFDVEAGSPYVVDEVEIAQSIEADGDRLFDEAAEANRRGDRFSLATVFFALALFFGGIATLFRRRGVSVGLLGCSAVALIIGSGVMFSAF